MHFDQGTDSLSKEKGMRASLVAGVFDTAITALAFSMASSSVLLADFLKTFIAGGRQLYPGGDHWHLHQLVL